MPTPPHHAVLPYWPGSQFPGEEVLPFAGLEAREEDWEPGLVMSKMDCAAARIQLLALEEHFYSQNFSSFSFAAMQAETMRSLPPPHATSLCPPLPRPHSPPLHPDCTFLSGTSHTHNSAMCRVCQVDEGPGWHHTFKERLGQTFLLGFFPTLQQKEQGKERGWPTNIFCV